MPSFGFIGPTYQARSFNSDAERSINLYPEKVESDENASKGTKWVLYGTPGRQLYCTLDDGPVACVVSSNQQFAQDSVTPIYFVVSGSTLYQVANHYDGTTFTGIPTTIGTVDKKIIAGTGGQLFPAQIIVINPNLLFVVANGRAWVAAFGSPILTSALHQGGLGYAVGDTGYVVGSNGLDAKYTITGVVTVPDGQISNSTIAHGGTGYVVGDTGKIVGGNNDATYKITAVDNTANGAITTAGPSAPGSGYVVGDVFTITGGDGTATGTVFQVGSLGGVLEITISNGGALYSPATGVATTGGSGTGLTIDILAVSSSNGGVLGYQLQTLGTGYSVANGVATTTGPPQAGIGTGFTINITGVSGGAGAVTSYTLTPGSGYTVGTDVATVPGGTQPGAGDGNFTINILSVGAAAWALGEQEIPAGSGLGGNFIESATYMDGYVIVSLGAHENEPERREFFISGLNDPSSWDPLDVGKKEANSDPIVAVFAAYEVLGVFGLSTLELWLDNPNGPAFPFQRMQGGGVLNAGLASPWTIATMDGTVVWLGNDMQGELVVWQLRGQTPIRVSNHAVEYRWRNYDVTGASAYSYQENGHYFYVLHFPIPDATWCMDSSTIGPDGKPVWHERASWDGFNWHADIGRYHAWSFPIAHVVGDYQANNLYIQSIDILSDNCQCIRRLRASPHIFEERRRFITNRFRVYMQTGTVPATGSGSNPQVSLRMSNDGGWTFGPYLTVSAGLIGEYGFLVQWYRTGISSNRIYEVSFCEQIPVAIVDAFVELIPTVTR